MDFIVRSAAKGDIAAVDALLARTYPRLLKPDYPPSVLVTALPLISRAQPALVTSGTYYVAASSAPAAGPPRFPASRGWRRQVGRTSATW